jgi:hypothetical protein
MRGSHEIVLEMRRMVTPGALRTGIVCARTKLGGEAQRASVINSGARPAGVRTEQDEQKRKAEELG